MSFLKSLTSVFRRKDVDPKDKFKIFNPPSLTREGGITLRDGKKMVYWKYTEETKELIARMIGRYMRPAEISEIMREDYGVKMSPESIGHLGRREKWQPVIEEEREKHLRNVHEVGMAHKRVRLDRSELMYDKAFRKGKVKECLQAVEQGRKEMEDKRSGVNINISSSRYYSMSVEELEAERKRLLNELKKNEGAVDVKGDVTDD